MRKALVFMKTAGIIRQIVNWVQIPYFLCAVIMIIVFQGNDFLLDYLYKIAFFVAMGLVALDLVGRLFYTKFKQTMDSLNTDELKEFVKNINEDE